MNLGARVKRARGLRHRNPNERASRVGTGRGLGRGLLGAIAVLGGAVAGEEARAFYPTSVWVELCSELAPPDAGGTSVEPDRVGLDACDPDLGLLAGLDQDVGYAVLFRALPDQLDDPVGWATLEMLRDSALFERSHAAWSAFADEVGMPAEDAFAELFARRAMLVLGRDTFEPTMPASKPDGEPGNEPGDGALRWALAVEVSEPIAKRLRHRLDAVPRGLDGGVPVMQLAEESVRVFWMDSPLGRPPQGERTPASDRVVTVVFSPEGEDALSKSILVAHAGQTAIARFPNDAVSRQPEGRPWPGLLEALETGRDASVLVRTPNHAGALARTETGWHARFVAHRAGDEASETRWSTDVLDELDTATLAAVVGSPTALGLSVQPGADRPELALGPAASTAPAGAPDPTPAPTVDRPQRRASGWSVVLDQLLEPARDVFASKADDDADDDTEGERGPARVELASGRIPPAIPGDPWTSGTEGERLVFGLQVRRKPSPGPGPDSGPADARTVSPGSKELVVSIGLERPTPRSRRGRSWSVATHPTLTVDPSRAVELTIPAEICVPYELDAAAGEMGAILTKTPSTTAESTGSGVLSSSVVSLINAGSARPALLLGVLGSDGTASSALGALRWVERVRWVSTRRGAWARPGGPAGPGVTVTDVAVELDTRAAESPMPAFPAGPNVADR